jgi:hypothetical protein
MTADDNLTFDSISSPDKSSTSSNIHEYIVSIIKLMCRLFYNLGVEISSSEITINLCDPHAQEVLPSDKMAVYLFFYEGRALKVGKAGPKSGARYTYQHYTYDGAKSCLGRSLCDSINFKDKINTPKENIGDWIRQNTCRVNLLIDANKSISILSLIESYLICVLKPEFEGFKSQNR